MKVIIMKVVVYSVHGARQLAIRLFAVHSQISLPPQAIVPQLIRGASALSEAKHCRH